MLVAEDSDGVLLKFNNVLVAELVVDFPKALVVVPHYSLYHPTLIFLLQISKDLRSRAQS